MLQKVIDAFKGIVDWVGNLYRREDVQAFVEKSTNKVKEVYGWVMKQVKEYPEAAIAGAIVAIVGFIAYSVLTIGIILTCLFALLFALGAHYYFTKPQEQA